MSDYTPSTEQVRGIYVRDTYLRHLRNRFIAPAGEHREEFDRWLAGVKREAAAGALEQSATAFDDRLADGTGNGRAYNSYTVARMLRAHADAIRSEATS